MAEILTLTKKDDTYVNEILKEKGELAISVPENLPAESILSGIRACVKWLNRADRVSYKLKPVLGRLMILAKKNPDVYKAAGYKTYTEFLKTELEEKFHISHSSLYEIAKVIKTFPNLTLEQYGKIPTASLLLLAKFTDYTRADHKKLLLKASEMTFDKLKEWVVEKGYLDKSDVESGATFSLTGSRTAVGRFTKFFKDKRVVAYCESDNWGKILDAMIEECSIEWLAKGESKLQEAAAQEGSEDAA